MLKPEIIGTVESAPAKHEDRERFETLKLWIVEALNGFKSPSKRKATGTTSRIAFGRCKAKEKNEIKTSRKSFCSKTMISRLVRLSNIVGRTTPMLSSDSFTLPGQQQWASVKSSLFSPQDNKHRGRQISNTKFDLKLASEKRNRQIQYSKEIQASRQDKSLDADSIFRVVVKSFCKLMNCERCSLFWMDHVNHELYFKPVGDEGLTGVIRFPASVGIAGWVATNKRMMNVPDAYQNDMFNKDVDRRTNFRTRTILCAPVLVDGTLFAVVQMLNKFTDVSCPREFRSSRKGFTNFRKYVPFSAADEELLKQCCEEVSKAVKGLESMDSSYALQEGKNANSSSEEDKTARRRSRRGSVGTLVKFIHQLSKPDQLPEPDLPISEAVTKFKFRSEDTTSSRRGSISTTTRRGSVLFKPDQLHHPDLPMNEEVENFNFRSENITSLRRGSIDTRSRRGSVLVGGGLECKVN